MRIEPNPETDTFNVTFEVVPDIEFQERVVAMNALGNRVSRDAGSAQARAMAYLGVRISKLNGLVETDGEPKPVSTETELSTEEVAMLATSLWLFNDDTVDHVRGIAASGDMMRCNVRAVEADIAQKMLATIKEKTGINQCQLDNARKPVGYFAPRQ